MTEFEKLVIERFDSIDKKFDEVNNAQMEILNRQESMQKDITKIKIHIENDVSPSIKMLSELQLENSKRLIRVERDIQEITDNIAIDEVLNNIKVN